MSGASPKGESQGWDSYPAVEPPWMGLRRHGRGTASAEGELLPQTLLWQIPKLECLTQGFTA